MDVSNPDKKISRIIDRLSQVVRLFQYKQGNRFDLSPVQVQILQYLKRIPDRGRLVGRISQTLGRSKSTISKSIDAMVSKDLIERKRSEQDRRKVKIQLTDHGEEVAKKVEAWEDELLNSLRHIDGDRKREAIRFFTDLIVYMSEENVQEMFDVCRTCVHAIQKDGEDQNDNDKLYYCRFFDEELKFDKFRMDCPEHTEEESNE